MFILNESDVDKSTKHDNGWCDSGDRDKKYWFNMMGKNVS